MTPVRVAENGALPNLIVIGAAQCGTSALHYYLDLHPEIQMSSPKELDFFVTTATSNWSRGVDWYASQFHASARVRGESSVSYTFPRPPGTAERMASVVPEAKLILLVRDPVERLLSQYLNNRGVWGEGRPLAEAVSGPNNAYVARSRYAANLRPFLERFPRSNIHLDRQEELLQHRRETMRRIFAFLEVDEGFWSPSMERLRNTSGRKGRAFRFAARLRRSRVVAPLYRLPPEAKWRIERLVASGRPPIERPTVEPALRRTLVGELEGDIAELEELTGWDLSAWRAT